MNLPFWKSYKIAWIASTTGYSCQQDRPTLHLFATAMSWSYAILLWSHPIPFEPGQKLKLS